MRNKAMKLAAFLTASVMIFSGCVGGGNSAMRESNYLDSADSQAAKASGNYGTADYDSYAAEEAVEGEYDYATEDAAMDVSDDENGSSNTSGSNGSEESSEQKAAESEEKLVYTCDLRMQTLTYDETLANIRKEIEKAGGIIQSENESNSGSNWYYEDYEKTRGEKSIYLTVRIPSKKYKSFLESLEGEGKILSKNSYVENITRRYHDTEAVIRNLETQEERLQNMMEQARTIEDMITIETRLTEVQTQLDQNRTYLSSMDTDVAYSTVNLTIEEVVRYSSDPPKTLTFLDRFQNALEGSWSNFLAFLEGLLFAIIYIAPPALFILIIVLIVLAIIKAWRKKHPKKPKAPKPPKTPRGMRPQGPPQGGYPYGQAPQGMPGSQPMAGPNIPQQGMPGSQPVTEEDISKTQDIMTPEKPQTQEGENAPGAE